MGCLSVNILAPAPTDFCLSVIGQNAISGSAECMNKHIQVDTGIKDYALGLMTACMNVDIAIGMLAKNVAPSVSVSLVCQVNIGGEFLMVQEGEVITIDGQYLKVLKA